MSIFSVPSNVELPHTTYDDLTDGSSTDGSISLLGDHEFLEERPIGSQSNAPQPIQFWMKCPKPELILTSRPIMRSHATERAVSTMTDSNRLDDNRKLFNDIAQSNVFNILLLILTGCSFAIFAVLYARYITPIYQSGQLKERVRTLEMVNTELSMKLMQCQLKSVEPTQVNEIIDDKQKPTSTSTINNNPIELTNVQSEKIGKIVWTGAGNIPQQTNLSPKKQSKYEHLCDEEIHDELFSDYIRDYCANLRQKNLQQKFKSNYLHKKKSERRSTDTNFILPNLSRKQFEFHEQFIDPNQFDNNNVPKSHYDDDYDFDSEFIIPERKKLSTKQFDNTINIDDVIHRMDEHVNKIMENCKQINGNDENVFDADIMRRAQKKLIKLKKQFKRNLKTAINTNNIENDYHDVGDSGDDDDNDDKRKHKHYERKQQAKKFREKHAQNRTMKMYKKTALKTYDE